MYKIRIIQFGKERYLIREKGSFQIELHLGEHYGKKMMSSDSLCNDKQHVKLPLLNLNKIKTNGREVQWPTG